MFFNKNRITRAYYNEKNKHDFCTRVDIENTKILIIQKIRNMRTRRVIKLSNLNLAYQTSNYIFLLSSGIGSELSEESRMYFLCIYLLFINLRKF